MEKDNFDFLDKISQNNKNIMLPYWSFNLSFKHSINHILYLYHVFFINKYIINKINFYYSKKLC